MSFLFKTQIRWMFHTNIKIKIPETHDDSVFDELFSVMENINKKYNSYSADSYIDRINKNSGKYVYVDETTVDMLETIKKYSDIFDGEYDITIMPLIKIWGFYKEGNKKIPTKKDITEALQYVDYRKIIIDKKYNRVKISKNQEIITGSFIKSYAVDKVIEKMKYLNISVAVINAGGSTIYSMNNDKIKTLEIGVEDPENIEEELFDIEICNESYSTSGQQNTYVEINGEKYGHIFSPKTGLPSKNKQIGLITKSAFLGDIITTGLYNQTPENFYTILKEISKDIKIEGYLMDEEYVIHKTIGFDEYIKNNRIEEVDYE